MRIKQLPDQRDAVAPDGSDVRVLLDFERGGLAHFELGPGETSVAVRHNTVEELWFFLGGRGEMWRKDAAGDETFVDVEPGVCIDIPLGVTFQFRSFGDEPLSAVGATMPRWPGAGEAVVSSGPWEPTVTPGPVCPSPLPIYTAGKALMRR